MIKQGLFFDLDGTLIDSVPDIAWGLDRALETQGLATVGVEHTRTWVGNGVLKLVERACRHLDALDQCDQVVAGFHQHYGQNDFSDTVFYPGVLETLKAFRAQGKQMAIITNKPNAFTQALLKKLQISELFDLVLGGDALARCKPDPMPLIHAQQTLELGLGQCLMVGDSVNDIKPAVAIGMDSVVLSYGYNQGLDVNAFGANHCLDRFDQLLDLVQ